MFSNCWLLHIEAYWPHSSGGSREWQRHEPGHGPSRQHWKGGCMFLWEEHHTSNESVRLGYKEVSLFPFYTTPPPMIQLLLIQPHFFKGLLWRSTGSYVAQAGLELTHHVATWGWWTLDSPCSTTVGVFVTFSITSSNTKPASQPSVSQYEVSGWLKFSAFLVSNDAILNYFLFKNQCFISCLFFLFVCLNYRWGWRWTQIKMCLLNMQESMNPPGHINQA